MEAQAKDLSAELATTPAQRLYLGRPVDPELRHRMRQVQSLPLWRQMKQYVLEMTSNVLPKSPLGRALTYARNQGARIERCFNDGRLELDNGVSERVLKVACLGRKNFLAPPGAPRAGSAWRSGTRWWCGHV